LRENYETLGTINIPYKKAKACVDSFHSYWKKTIENIPCTVRGIEERFGDLRILKFKLKKWWIELKNLKFN